MRYINTRLLLLLLLLLPCEMQSAKLFQIMQKIPLKKSHFNFDTHVNVAGSTTALSVFAKNVPLPACTHAGLSCLSFVRPVSPSLFSSLSNPFFFQFFSWNLVVSYTGLWPFSRWIFMRTLPSPLNIILVFQSFQVFRFSLRLHKLSVICCQ